MILVDQFCVGNRFPLTPNLSHDSPYSPISGRKKRQRLHLAKGRPSAGDAAGAADGDGLRGQWTGLSPITACASMPRGGYRSRLLFVRCWPGMASKASIAI